MASLGHFNVAIVGGGPAGTALIIRAAREGRLRDLLGCDPPAGGDTADPSEAPRGLVLIEGGGRCNLGVGMLKKCVWGRTRAKAGALVRRRWSPARVPEAD